MPTINLTLPVAGTVATAGLIANDLTILQTLLNGGLDTSNWGAGLIFPPSKFQQEGAGRQDGMVWNGSIWVPKAVASVYDRVTTFTNADIQNDATEKSIYTKSIIGNDMGTNKMLRLTVLGDFLHNNVAADTATLRIKFGGTTFYSAAMDLGNVIGAARHPWSLHVNIANLGTANSQMIEGFLMHEAASIAAPGTGIGFAGKQAAVGDSFPLGIGILGTIDTTSAQTLDVTIQWSAASANNSWRSRYALLEII